MPYILAFDWDDQSLYVALGNVRSDSVRLVGAERIGFDEDVNPSDPEQVGRFLQQELAKRRVDVRTAVACVDRRHVVLHRLKVPAAEPDELAKVVHFQATTELIPDESSTTYDFIITGHDESHVHVAILAVPLGVVERYRRAAAAAGLKLRAVRAESMSWLAAQQVWSRAPTSTNGAVDVVLVRGRRAVEAIAAREGRFLGSELVPVQEAKRAAASGGAAEPAAEAELALRRLGASLSTQVSAAAPVGSYLACAPSGSDWHYQLEQKLGGQVKRFDPLAPLDGQWSVESWDRLAALAGAIAQEAADPDQLVDFLAPRRPKPPHPLRRHAVPIGIACAAVLLTAYGLYVRHQLGLMDSELQRWRAQERKVAAQYKKLRGFRRQYQVVAAWTSSRLDWLAEYERVLRLLPGPSELYLTRVSFSQGRGGGYGTIRLEGYAASQQVVAETMMKLAGAGVYRVRPSGLVPGSRSSNYPWRFEAELTILRPARQIRPTDQPPPSSKTSRKPQ